MWYVFPSAYCSGWTLLTSSHRSNCLGHQPKLGRSRPEVARHRRRHWYFQVNWCGNLNATALLHCVTNRFLLRLRLLSCSIIKKLFFLILFTHTLMTNTYCTLHLKAFRCHNRTYMSASSATVTRWRSTNIFNSRLRGMDSSLDPWPKSSPISM